MSNRSTIYDTAAAALLASSGISYVSKNINEDPFAYTEDKYPAVRLIDGDMTVERFCYPGSTAQLDMKSELDLNFTGYARELNKSSTALHDSLAALLSDIEVAVVTDSTLLALVQDVTLDGGRTDMGYSDGVGFVNGTFRVTYLYNHTSP